MTMASSTTSTVAGAAYLQYFPQPIRWPSCAAAEMPTAKLSEADLKDGNIDILDLLVKSGLVSSRSEDRRAVEQGGVSVNDDKVTDVNMPVPAKEFVLHKGKKVHVKIIVR